MNNQYYLVGYDIKELKTIKDLLSKQRNVKTNIIHTLSDFDEIIKDRRGNENIKIIYVDFRLNNSLYEFYNQLRDNETTVEDTLKIITLEIESYDKADFRVQINTENNKANIVHKIWEFIRKCEKED